MLRPDIYDKLNLQNAHAKLVDNSVRLVWNTTYDEYKTSELFKVSSKLLSYNQESEDLATMNADMNCWFSYLDWKLKSTSDRRRHDDAFMNFLRISLSRPRDISQILKILQEVMTEKGDGDKEVFKREYFFDNSFQNRYSEYFMGSLKDQLMFYYSDNEYQTLTRFIESFKYKEFTFEQFKEKYKIYYDEMTRKNRIIPSCFNDCETLLQILYTSNVIAYVEIDYGKRYWHFSYKDSSHNDICPKVSTEDGILYVFHPGVYKKGRKGKF